jgi:hypothetical protein
MLGWKLEAGALDWVFSMVKELGKGRRISDDDLLFADSRKYHYPSGGSGGGRS